MTRTRLAAAALAALIALSGVGFGTTLERTAAQDRLSIATGGTGGVYYPYGGGMASVLSDDTIGLQGYDVTAEVTAASVDNMYLIESGDADIAFALGDTAFDAVQGNDPFTEPVAARNLATLYNNYTHVVTTAGSGINSVADLRDKRVSTGSPGSGTEVIANRIMAAAGLDPEADIQREQLGAGESADAIKDRQIDAYFWSGGLPTASVTDLGATPGISLKLLPTTEFLPALQQQYGALYASASIPANQYPGQSEPLDVIVVANLLVVNAEMDEQLAYDILRVLFANQPQLVQSHPEANNLTLENATRNSSIDYHPGALRFYQEQGVEVQPPGTTATPAATPAA
ncbi:MAG: TRAP transporter solute receptor, TAXI family precursor [uncultured Thermomicrobiales bacterium]|uniref:TRAP transporter solute receptor, TAXI family n=1 Tax=uncultured Thermomicrobiales bacterium TaxID=1645740 RepID=A0A6J4UC56_9BACT|nr:MAG: TRAP transporter solute receptor, TAXI family precursor [uncultured Thermomicrobiales bacterium]